MKTLNFIFIKHDATALHYDLRLEIEGIESWWAVPKGPTLDPTVKRLAVQITDNKHQEKYGEGPEVIWDEGEYVPEVEVVKGVRKEIHDFNDGEKIIKEGIEKGEVKFFLKGKKIKGSFALVKTNGFPPGVKNAWLLIKHKDTYAKAGFDAKDY